MKQAVVTILYALGSLCFLVGTLVNYFWTEGPPMENHS